MPIGETLPTDSLSSVRQLRWRQQQLGWPNTTQPPGWDKRLKAQLSKRFTFSLWRKMLSHRRLVRSILKDFFRQLKTRKRRKRATAKWCVPEIIISCYLIATSLMCPLCSLDPLFRRLRASRAVASSKAPECSNWHLLRPKVSQGHLAACCHGKYILIDCHDNTSATVVDAPTRCHSLVVMCMLRTPHAPLPLRPCYLHVVRSGQPPYILQLMPGTTPSREQSSNTLQTQRHVCVVLVG